MRKIRLFIVVILSLSTLFGAIESEEILSKRTLNSKTYDLGAGRYRLDIFAYPIHILNEQGNLLEYSNDGSSGQVLNQADLIYPTGQVGSYALLDSSVGGDTTTTSQYGYIGSRNTSNDFQKEIYRTYVIFNNEDLQVSDPGGDVKLDGVGTGFSVSTSSSFTEFNSVLLRAGLRSASADFPESDPTIDQYNDLASFGTQFDNIEIGDSPGSSVLNEDYTSGSLFQSVKSIIEDGVSDDLNIIIKKESESFNYDATHYILVNSPTLSIDYHIQTVRMANVDEDNGNDNLGDWLSLYKNSVRDSVYSGDTNGLEVFEGQNYSALTHKYQIDGQRHRAWNDELGEHKVKWSNFAMTAARINNGLNAKFKSRNIIDLSSCLLDGVTFQDPWYIQNDTLINPESWIQPDTLLPVTTLAPSGTYRAFLGQLYATGSYYSISTPKVIEDSTNEYLVFNQWKGTGLNFDGEDSTGNRTTPVTFTTYGATPTPDYYELTIVGEADISAPGDVVYLEAPALIVEGGTFKKLACSVSDSVSLTPQTTTPGDKKYRIDMTGDGTITLSYTPIISGDMVEVSSSLEQIPAGTPISMPSATQIDLYDPSRFAGSSGSPITLSGASGVDWHGIRIADDLYEVSLENLVIEDAIVAIWTDESLEDVSLINVTIDGATTGFDNIYDYGDDFDSIGVTPHLTEPLTNFRLTNCTFSNISGVAIQGQAVDLGNIGIYNCEFSPVVQGSGTAIRFEIFDTPWHNAPEYHETFDSLQVINNVIDGFETGVKLRFKQTQNDISWSDDYWNDSEHERVVLQANEISNCDTGIVMSGNILVFSHHNIIDNCDVGYKIEYPDLDLPPLNNECDSLRYRILNETIIGNGSSVGILDQNPMPDQPNQTLTTFIGSCILANHDTAAYNAYATVFQNSILYDNSIDFTEGFANYDCWEDTTNLEVNPLFVDYTNGDYRLLSSSPAIDGGYADFDGDGTTYVTDADDQDEDGSRMDIGALGYPSPTSITSPLTISADTEWHGNYQVGADITVASGATLTILPGSNIEFSHVKEDPTRFTINGDLIADGLPDAKITFTSSETTPGKEDWYAIMLNFSVNDNITILDNCVVEYSKYGIWMSGASPDISNNIVRHNTYGMQARSSSNPDITSNRFSHNNYGTYNYLSSPKYTDNLIDSNSTRGMYHNGTSTPWMYNNTIQRNTGFGVYMYNHADVQFGHLGADDRGLNEIINNSSYGVYASYYCDPFLGTSDPYNGAVAGYNSIHDNGTYNLRTYNNSTAEAEHNWWDGETAWSWYLNSSYDTSPVLGSEPSTNLGSSLAKSAFYDGYVDCPNYDFFSPDTNSECALWYWAHDLRITDQLPVALWAWELFVQKFPATDNAVLALIKIANYTPSEEYEGLIGYLFTVLNGGEYSDQLRVKALELLMGLHIKTGEFQDANSLALSLLDQALCSDQERIALFSLVDLNQFSLGKATAATGFLERMKEEYPDDELTLMAAELMGEDVDWAVVQFEEDEEDETQTIIPEKFALHNAYPNPFNPVTTIRYDLSKESNVQLNVYDITGRLVTSLVSKSQASGSYNVQWNGMDADGNILPSGLYIYSLQAGEFVATSKMLLLK